MVRCQGVKLCGQWLWIFHQVPEVPKQIGISVLNPEVIDFVISNS